MLMKMRPRYYCEHCKKGSGSPSAMKRHESGCTANPGRVCRMCAMLADEGGPDPAPQRDELIKIMDEQGFKAMCDAANGCPACILSALRTKNFKGDAESPPCVLGPEDGRETWSYKQAKDDWWSEWNSGQYEKYHPY